jgi:NAD(P)-dependent dehydrogenase (short-subunit alcohol dehydrogenase family)
MKRLAVITGTTHGIGRVTAQSLAAADFHVVQLCRNLPLAKVVAEEIQATHPDASVDSIACDLADLTSVRGAGIALREHYGPLTLLILNAGMAATTRQRTASGMDLNFAVNHLGHFLLVELLRGQMAPQGRIITVGSLAHYRGTLDLDAVQQPDERIAPISSYARSKLANVLHSLALARRLDGSGITANCVHPGIVATNLLPRWVQWIQRVVRRQMFDETRGAESTLKLALGDEFEGRSGLYLNEFGVPVAPSARARDEQLQEALWRRSLQWVAPHLDEPAAC